MRYDTPIYFQRDLPAEYDANTGNYIEQKPEEVQRFASVTDSGAETIRLVYGELKQGSKTVRLQTHYTAPFDRIRIGNKCYKVDLSRELRTKHNFVVSEVQ